MKSFQQTKSICQRAGVILAGCAIALALIPGAAFAGAVIIGTGLNSAGNQVPFANTSAGYGLPWSNQTLLPLPKKVLNGENIQLASEACGIAGINCVAVGSSESGIDTFDGQGIAYFSNDGGKTWTASKVQPALPQNDVGALYGVACGAFGQQCIAGGYYIDATGAEYNLAYSTIDGGNTWQNIPLPVMPSNASEPSLNAFSCNFDASVCTAVGAAVGTNTQNAAFPFLYSLQFVNLKAQQYNEVLGNENNAYILNGSISGFITCDFATGQKCVMTGSQAGTDLSEQVFTSNGQFSYTTNNVSQQGSWGNLWTFAPLPANTTGNGIGNPQCDTTMTNCLVIGGTNSNVTGQYLASGNPNPDFGYTFKPVYYTSNNGGKTWGTTQYMPLPVGTTNASVSLLNCAFATGQLGQCTTLGATLITVNNAPVSQIITYTTSDGGAIWSPTVNVPNSNHLLYPLNEFVFYNGATSISSPSLGN